MKRTLLHILILLLCLPGANSCVRELLPHNPGLSSGEGWLTVRFSPRDNAEISTRATLGAESEKRVLNLFIFLFDANGNKIYGKWFEYGEKKGSLAEVSSSAQECWYVDNTAAVTSGSVKIKAPAGSGYKLYAIANLDADMVRISSDLLNHRVGSEAELLEMPIWLNQESVSRNGYFPMTGMLGNVELKAGTDNLVNSGNPLRLKRLDAKIRFIFKAGTRPDERGETIRSFTARQWRVVNVPLTSCLMDYASRGKTASCGFDSGDVPPSADPSAYSLFAPKFFDTDWVNFEDFTAEGTSEFSFYMLENRMVPKNAGFGSYQDRSRQVKLPDGRNGTAAVSYVDDRGKRVSKEMRLFSNANDFSTYVLVTGRVDMDLTDDSAGRTLGGDVQYLIHLGSWNSSIASGAGDIWSDDSYGGISDFNTLRNTSYTYTVTVNSVNNIRVEVESAGDGATENQPGASGQITIAKEEIAICDAHYASKTLTFHAANFFQSGVSIADDLTWSVKTPFGEGTPGAYDEPSGSMDYKWVHFRLNKKGDDGNYFSEKRRKFTTRVFESYAYEQDNPEDDGSGNGLRGRHNDGCMDIVALVKYIKEQVNLYVQYKTQGGENRSAFDEDTGGGGPKICVTAFVDEFYYDRHPITGETSPTLWKRFVNQPDRTMHILCNSSASRDLESRATGSVVTIQQRSIQSIYNTDLDYTGLQTAWGLEYVDEFSDKIYSNNVSSGFGGSGLNTDSYNGLSNSVFEWELNQGSGASPALKSGVRWDKYLEFEEANDSPQMKSGYKSLRYFCMARNRDNNGDGKIDRDEIRWYTASIKQLIGLYVGNNLIDPHSRLYYRSKSEQDTTVANIWRQHTISSTKYSTNSQPTVIWGEEGTSYGDISGSVQWGGIDRFSVRCVRNLGMDPDHALGDTPEDYITVSPDPDGNSGSDVRFTFNCTHLNDAALRYYTSRELEYHAQTSEMNRLYKSFQVASKAETRSFGATDFPTFNGNISADVNSGAANRYCPEGYRIPNQLELTMMRFYLENVDSSIGLEHCFTRTYWSFGVVPGIDKDSGGKYGYAYDTNIYLAKDQTVTAARCVKDIRAD